jgi:alpha-tubulin suppressor-like RCC1 family protein
MSCGTAVDECSLDCTCNAAALDALTCIEDLGGNASLAAGSTCVAPLVNSSDTTLSNLGSCLVGSCRVACGGAAADAGACDAVGTPLTALLDAGTGACESCLQASCTSSIATCAGDCACNATAVAALECLANLGDGATLASATACLGPVAAGASNPALAGLGVCLYAHCEATCGTAADGGTDASDASSDAGGTDSTVEPDGSSGDANVPEIGPLADAPVDAPLGEGGLGTVIAIHAGDDTTCALYSSGSVQCCGDNSYGQIGNGTDGEADTPALVSGLSGVTAVAGFDNECALLSGGTVECWGENQYGELGNGTVQNHGNSPYAGTPTPVPVSGLSGVAALSVGDEVSCALLTNGTVECWGDDSGGQLGNGAYGTTAGPGNCDLNEGGAVESCATTPVAVSGLTGVTAISAGAQHTCALLSNATVECWGINDYGEIGVPISTATSPCVEIGMAPAQTDVCVEPVPVPGLTGVTAISAGVYHTCALLSGGTVKCWGEDFLGTLGNGTMIGAGDPTPVQVCADSTCASPLSGVTAISAGYSSTCALLTNGTVVCWGDNSHGELGDGTTTGPEMCDGSLPCSTTPVAVTGLSGVTAISVGGFYACALLAGGAVECWGLANSGELGNGGGLDQPTPVAAAF